VGNRGRTLRTWDRKQTPEIFEGMANIEELATQMISVAEGEAETAGSGSHRFEIRTQQHLNGRQSTSFRIVIEDYDNSSNSLVPEKSDALGQIAQQMRHSEFSTRALIQLTGTVTSSLQRQIAQLSEDNNRLLNERSQMIKQLEDVRFEEEDRMTQLALATSADERKNEILQKLLLPLAPVVLSKLMSGNKTGTSTIESSSTIAKLANEFFKSLTPEQAAKIMGAISMSQMMILKEINEISAANTSADEKKDSSPTATPATT
jgi:hypothetical protein